MDSPSDERTRRFTVGELYFFAVESDEPIGKVVGAQGTYDPDVDSWLLGGPPQVIEGGPVGPGMPVDLTARGWTPGLGGARVRATTVVFNQGAIHFRADGPPPPFPANPTGPGIAAHPRLLKVWEPGPSSVSALSAALDGGRRERIVANAQLLVTLLPGLSDRASDARDQATIQQAILALENLLEIVKLGSPTEEQAKDAPSRFRRAARFARRSALHVLRVVVISAATDAGGDLWDWASGDDGQALGQFIDAEAGLDADLGRAEDAFREAYPTNPMTDSSAACRTEVQVVPSA